MAKVAPEKNEDQNGQSAEKEQQVFQKSLDFGARDLPKFPSQVITRTRRSVLARVAATGFHVRRCAFSLPLYTAICNWHAKECGAADPNLDLQHESV